MFVVLVGVRAWPETEKETELLTESATAAQTECEKKRENDEKSNQIKIRIKNRERERKKPSSYAARYRFMDLYQFSDCSFFYGHEGEMAPKAKHSIKDEAKLVLLLLALWSLECHFDMCPSGLAAAAWAGKAEWDEPTTRGCFHGNKLQNEFNYLSRIFVPICQIGMLICAQVQGRVHQGGRAPASELFTYT